MTKNAAKARANYAARKDAARDFAMWYQSNGHPLSYDEMLYYQSILYKLAKRYGLLTEFTDNGIL